MSRESFDLDVLDALPDGAAFTDVLRRVYAKCEEDGTGCWIWGGCCPRDDQPLMTYEGRPQMVRRAVFQETRGLVKRGFVVSRTCESVNCVAPKHMKEQSKRDHRREQVTKGTAPRTTRARTEFCRKQFGKLDMEKARAIRASDETEIVLAERYGVSHTAIGMARRGETWKEPSPFAGLGAR